MTKSSPRSPRWFRTADREAIISHVAVRHRALFFRHFADFVALLFRNAIVVLLFLPALLGAVAALIWNARTIVFAKSSRRHPSIHPATVFGFLSGLVLGLSCVCR